MKFLALLILVVMHVVHNASKHFSNAFSSRVEHLLDHIYVDLNEINLRDLQQIANVLGVSLNSFPRRLDHRWLSQLPGLQLLLENWNLYRLLYSAFIRDSDEFQFDLDKEIGDSVTLDGRDSIIALLANLKDRYKQKKTRAATILKSCLATNFLL